MTVRDSRCKPYEFIRYGDLSSIKQEWFKKRKVLYHASPVRHGIFVMSKKHFCRDLVFFKVYDQETEIKKDMYRKKMKHIKYCGKIWTHYYYPSPDIRYYRRSGSWFETDTSCIDKILQKAAINYYKLSMKYENARDEVEGKGISFSKIKQRGRRFIWWNTEFFIERI